MSIKYKLKRLYRRLHPSKSRYKYREGDDGVQRHHDPYWYLDDEDGAGSPRETSSLDGSAKRTVEGEDWREHGEPLQQGRLHNRTDYDLPQGWGSMSEEQKSQWYLRQRVWRQINRQYDAGMWDQWDVETLRAGLTPRETAEQVYENENEYRFSDDD